MEPDSGDSDQSEGTQTKKKRPSVPKKPVPAPRGLTHLRERTESPELSSSSPSILSDRSVGRLIDFRKETFEPPASLKSDRSEGRLIDFRKDQPGPSDVSLKSDRSVGRLIDFRKDQPGPSDVSLKSDRSVGRLIDFRENNDRKDPTVVSMRSDRSVGRLIDFRKETSEPPASIKSDQSMGRLIDFSDRSSSEEKTCALDALNSTFKRLEESMVNFVKQQLRGFLRVLAEDYPECSETEGDEEQSSRDALLKITLDFLRRMKQEDLAERLHNKTNVGVCREKLKQRLQQSFSRVFEGTSKTSLSSDLQQIFTELHITEGGAAEVNQVHEVRLIQAASRRRAPESLVTGEDLFKKPAPAESLVTREDLFKKRASESLVTVEDLFKKPAPAESLVTREDLLKKRAPESLVTREDLFKKPAPAESLVVREDLLKKRAPESLVVSEDLFRSRSGDCFRAERGSVVTGPIRTVLTKGVAGVGKTLLTQKVSLDWAEGRAHQDVQLLFPFTFRELNVLRGSEFSLVGLLHRFFRQTKGLRSFEDLQLLFILDGLDECRLPLDFSRTRVLTEPTESASVEELLVNLIRGDLLPSARLWITTRPAAANQIPEECVSMVTEVQGFSDPQKEQYFRKRFRDQQQASAVIFLIKTSQSLYAMCHLPIFCWILSTVLLHLMDTRETGELPTTLTQMYIHFLVVQAKVKNIKYHGGSGADLQWTPETREMVLSLGKLAFEQLLQGNLIFYESDLSECGLDAAEIARYSGVFTQVFREESGLYQGKVYCFIHLSVQEFLAALHVHHAFFSSGQDLLSPQQTSDGKTTNTEPTKSKVKHKVKSHKLRKNSDSQSERASTPTTFSTSAVDPEVTFYHSAVDQALQSPNGHLDLLLRFLLGLSVPTNQSLLQGLLTPTGSERTNQETAEYIKEKLSEGSSTESSLNLFHCLNELNDRGLLQAVQRSLSDGSLAEYEVSAADWAAVAFILLTSDPELEEFDLRKFCPSEDVLLKLMPVVKASNKAILSSCGLSAVSCALLASDLRSSALTHLDLSNNDLQDLGVELLCDGLKSAPCRLQMLSLSRCGLTHRSCAPLASVLSSSTLTHLDLSNNDLWNSGVELLCKGLQSAPCRLHMLSLSGCLVSERGGASLAAALSSASSRLRVLDLSYNHPGPSTELLSAAVRNPHCPLDSLRLDPLGKVWMVPGLRKYCCAVSLDGSSDGARHITSDHSDYLLHHSLELDSVPQVHSSSPLTGRSYLELDWEVDDEADWSRAVDISVAYRRRPGGDLTETSGAGSWTLRCFKGNYSVHHNRRDRFLSACPSRSGRVGVFLDSEAGALSFYELRSDALCHLHTFSSSFTQPLFLRFGLRPGSSVSLVDTVVLSDRDSDPAPAPPPPPRLPAPPEPALPQGAKVKGHHARAYWHKVAERLLPPPEQEPRQKPAPKP